MTNTLPSFNSSHLRRFKSVQTSSQSQIDENANYYNQPLELPSHEFLKVSFEHRLRTPPHKSVAEKILRYDDFNYTLIGEGFFAQVFKASSKPQTPNSVKSSKILALKRNKPNNPIEQNKNILRERLILEKLKHNNILKFEGVCLIDNQIHVFTEYVNGGSIANAIHNQNFNLSINFGKNCTIYSTKNLIYPKFTHPTRRKLSSPVILQKHSPISMTRKFFTETSQAGIV